LDEGGEQQVLPFEKYPIPGYPADGFRLRKGRQVDLILDVLLRSSTKTKVIMLV
jgi:hypothetical protein